MSDIFDDLAILPSCNEQIAILRADESLLLINKPTRLLSVPGRHPQNRDSVISRLQGDYAGASIVHRLDFDTSGIMVVPLNKAVLSHISKQFQARTVTKRYTAVVAGLIEHDEGVIDLPIAPDADNRPKYKICRTTGKPSLTEYRVLARDREQLTTRVLLHPITGRSHQLRLHLQAIGHPILGCEFYGDVVNGHAVNERAVNKSSAQLKANRLLLHATYLEFVHPVTGGLVCSECPPIF